MSDPGRRGGADGEGVGDRDGIPLSTIWHETGAIGGMNQHVMLLFVKVAP